jgi:hypothetical protein
MWLRFAMTPEYRLVQVSDDEFARLEEQVEPPIARLEQIADLIMGDWKSWPCPFHASRQSCDAVSRVDVDERGVPLMPDPDEVRKEEGERIWGFITDLKGGLLRHFADREMDKYRPGARVYRCAQHGAFLVGYANGEPNPNRIYVPRDGVFVERWPRYTVCPGLYETVDAGGNTAAVEVCLRMLEWEGAGSEIGLGDGAYTCPVHGSQRYGADGSFSDFPSVVARRITS